MVTTSAKASPAQSNQSAEKLLAVMEAMAGLDEPIHLKELAARLRMNISTVSRFLAPLQKWGYVDQDLDTNRYYMTFKLCGLASRIAAHMDTRNLAKPFLRNVARIFQESANLVVENDMSALYIETVRGSSQTIMAMQRIGHIAPLHCTGAGKILLTEYSEQELDKYIAVKGLPGFTGNTITNRDDLEKELETIRRRGYALDNEECETGSRCVAVPIRDYTDSITAILSVSGPVSRMTNAHIHDNLPYLREASEQISRRLGWGSVPAASNEI